MDKPRVEALVLPICRAHGVELVDVQWSVERGAAVLRVLIDRERADVEAAEPASGVSITDCQHVSRDLSMALDVHDDVLPTGRYRLEVSSPGLDRPLVKESDFARFAGKEIKLQTRRAVAGAPEDRRKFQGVLEGITEGIVRVQAADQAFDIPFGDIAKANVVYRFDRS